MKKTNKQIPVHNVDFLADLIKNIKPANENSEKSNRHEKNKPAAKKGVVQVQLDGYDFGDRTLEGLEFVGEIKNDKVINVFIDPNSDNEYWQKLNTKKWIKQAKEYLQDILDQNGGLKQSLENEELSLL